MMFMLLIMIMLIIMVMFLLSMMIILLKHIVHSIINYAEDYAHFFCTLSYRHHKSFKTL